ncbi:hypothetical protein Tco_0669384 [Tanacetum coccineum]
MCRFHYIRPPMLDRTDFASWQQRIRLYCQGPCEDALWKALEINTKRTVNSKFVNNMFPEWGRFVTAVKLNRGLRDSNYDQLYAYLKQHEALHEIKNVCLDPDSTQHTSWIRQPTIDDDVDEKHVQDLALNVNIRASSDSMHKLHVHDHDHYSSDAVCEHHRNEQENSHELMIQPTML